jgi:MYXO-CTERM domain-containing protein
MRLHILASTATCALVCSGSLARADIAAQFAYDNSGNGATIGLNAPAAGYANTSVGMTFLSHTSGTFATLSVLMYSNPANPGTLTASMFTMDGSGLPGALITSTGLTTADMLLQTGNASGSGIALVTFDFSAANAGILSGQSYAFTLVSSVTGSYDGGPTPPYGTPFNNNTFGEGHPLQSVNGTSWYLGSPNVPFTVTSTIPAPGAAAVLGLGGLLAARRRRA